jgi:hypothetical protein
MKLLISTFFTLLIAVEVQAQKPDLVPLIDIFGQAATTYAQNNGLENTAYEFGEDNTGEFAKFTGYKTLNGLAITFRVYMYAAEESYITLYAGTPSSSYPQRAILEFFESLKIGR